MHHNNAEQSNGMHNLELK